MLQDDAERTIKEWENGIKEREPAKKRDSVAASSQPSMREVDMLDSQADAPAFRNLTQERDAEGDELDRVFGGMAIRQ